jgi:hypothetical protein
MKLHEIKENVPSTELLAESTIPIHISMILAEVIRAGKVTNGVQYVILSQLVELFKCAPYNTQAGMPVIEIPKEFGSAIKPRYMYENQPKKQLLDEVKALEPADQVKLAYWCATQLATVQTEEEAAKWVNPQMGLSAWVQFVNQAQD